MKKILLESFYLAPIQYYSKLLNYKALIEVNENYTKQTYRNRCKIYSANGIQTLSIPVKNEKKQKTLVKDVKISYETNWQKQHYKSIKSAYGRSPFYEYFIDEIKIFYFKKYKFLLDFNTEFQNLIIENLEIENNFSFTKNYISKYQFDILDFRGKISPKKKLADNEFLMKNYIQVFENKFGFKSNLSIIDLLFNEGPNAISFL
ncbi:MAG: hypothetical protein B6I24_04010 [Bacteroidetes bacterium 4572_128]|nr:MAG: hypothetical protein B6I24_04010 [Bacteroidetes bacterium 4572_128]